MLQENSVFNQTCLLMPNSWQTLLVWNLFELNVWYRDHFFIWWCVTSFSWKLYYLLCWKYASEIMLLIFLKKSEAVMWNGVGIQCVTITRHCKLLLIQALRNCFQEGSILLLPSCYQSSAAGNESLSFFRAMTLIEGTAGSFNWIPLGREDIDPTG